MKVYRIEIYKGNAKDFAWDIWYLKAKSFWIVVDKVALKLSKETEYNLWVKSVSMVCELDN